MASAMVDSPTPLIFFCLPIQTCSHNIIFRKCTESNADFVKTVEEYLFEKWLTPWKAQIVLRGGDILLIKIKIRFPAGQNLEIMTFRYLKTLVFDKFF